MSPLEELKVSKIKQGTVIDHIRAGMAPAVLKILGIDRGASDVVVVAMNVRSRHLGRKDIVKIENRIIDEETLKRISIIAPQATINLVKDYEIVEKHGVSLPEELQGILKCPNRNCITNSPERLETLFVHERAEPVEYRCHYCEELVEADHAELIL
jgi:aspartate carbamoyltransferase regulatory subunit